MESPNPHPAKPDQKLRWYQYRLRTLFLLMLLVSIGMSWVAVTIQGYRRQRDAAEAIEKEGGQVIWAERPGWLGKLLRDDSLRDVTVVNFWGREHTNAVLAHLEALSQLQGLTVFGSKVTDAGLVHLETLRQLQELSLCSTNNVTDAGLVHLEALSQLQVLCVSSTKVTDAGLIFLHRLNQLQGLSLLCDNITDAGLAHLQGLSQLQRLDLCFTKVSDRGVKKLQRALPRCSISH